MSITSEDEEEGSTLLSDARSDDLLDTSESELSDGDGDGEPLPPPPFSHTFAPPFYGRPPTPLPPSPSLTSLLRPSRPTTPDASDDDLAAPVPRATPRVPTYEYYGFVLYLFSSLTFLIYLLWSFLPSPFLHALGIYYYPNRWWALAIPSFLVMTLCYIFVALAAYNTEILTLPLSDIETIVDEASKVAVVDAKGRIRADDRRRRERRREGREGRARKEVVLPGGGLNWKEVWNEGTDAVMDIPLAGVCEVLYGDRSDDGMDGDVNGNGDANGSAW